MTSINAHSLEASWQVYLKDEFEKPYMLALIKFLHEEITQGKTILPKPSEWFKGLNTIPFKNVKVVIIGQDPYPTLGHAHGLCFSVLPQIKPLPKSLINIHKELLGDLNIDNSHSGYLQSWAEQGVLLLNSVLTVEKGSANSHQGKGWEQFTDKIIQSINGHSENIVFILWGAYAQKKGALVDTKKHYILKAAHPSPLSAYRGFFGSKPFSRTNQYLISHNKAPISWALK